MGFQRLPPWPISRATLIVPEEFEPPGIAGMRNWYKSDVGLFQDVAGTTPAVNDNDPVRRWEDQQGSDHVTQDNSTSPSGTSNTGNPTLQTSELNGFAAVSFGLTEILWGGSYGLDNTSAATIFIVGKRNQGGAHGVASFHNGNNPGEDFGITSETAVRVNSGQEVWINDPLSDIAYNYMTFQRPASANVNQVTFRLNGTDRTRTSGQPEALKNENLASREIVLGQTPHSGPVDGDVSLVEVLVYERDLSASEVDEVEAYIQSRYGL